MLAITFVVEEIVVIYEPSNTPVKWMMRHFG
jgi:hypothetical protein